MKRVVSQGDGGGWNRTDTSLDDGLSLFDRILVEAAGDDERDTDEDLFTVCDESDLFDGMDW